MSVLVIIFLTAVLALFLGVFGQGRYSRYAGILGLSLAFGLSFMPECSFFQQYENMYKYTEQTALFTRISILVTALIFLIADFAFSNHRSHQSELYALLLFALCGGIILFGYENFVTLFLGIEILSIPLYVLVGSEKTNLRSIEGALKYFLMGAFMTGFLMFGVALIYGASGSLDIDLIQKFAIENPENKMFILGALLMLVALAFKVSLAPFHLWSPDVYQGAPSLITSFMASVVKISGFVAMYKLLTFCFSGILPQWLNVMGILVIITLILANVMGLAQSNAKRMLAYSSVSHAGYIAIIFFGFTQKSYEILSFYLLAYSLATIGVFMALIWVEKVKREVSFEAFKGLGKTKPILAVVASVSLFSMAGIPLTAGFIGKFNILSQAISTMPFIVLVAILGSAISIAYYLRLIIVMFFAEESSFNTSQKVNFTYILVAVFIVLALIILGIYPDAFSLMTDGCIKV